MRFLLKNPDILLKNVDLIMKTGLVVMFGQALPFAEANLDMVRLLYLLRPTLMQMIYARWTHFWLDYLH